MADGYCCIKVSVYSLDVCYLQASYIKILPIINLCPWSALLILYYLIVMNKVCKHFLHANSPLGFDINKEKKEFCIFEANCITKKLEANQGK